MKVHHEEQVEKDKLKFIEIRSYVFAVQICTYRKIIKILLSC